MNKYPNYLFFNFDINQDGLKDYVITSNSDNGDTGFDDLYVYLSLDGKKYQFLTHGTNFNEDGGNKFLEIVPRSNGKGFILSTYFPDRGYHIKDYYISPLLNMKNQWVLEKIVEKGYISRDISGKYYEDYFYYCNHVQKSNFFTYDMRISFGNYDDEEKLEKCSISMEYTVSEQQAEILNNDFRKLNPKNYFILGDKVVAIDQNDDWIKVVYKNGKKVGWVNKKNLIPK